MVTISAETRAGFRADIREAEIERGGEGGVPLTLAKKPARLRTHAIQLRRACLERKLTPQIRVASSVSVSTLAPPSPSV
jgi:hypothetical protein